MFNHYQNKKVVLFIVIALIAVIGITLYSLLFGAPKAKSNLEQFTIPIANGQMTKIPDNFMLSRELRNKGFINSNTGFNFALGKISLQPGTYKISKSMSAWQIAKIFKQEPFMKWVVIPEGYRKEQIAEILARQLNWSQQTKIDWITKNTATKSDYIEGVYFPDTYLIPVNETPEQIAKIFINKFNEKFAPYLSKFQEENIKWTTALKLASIIQREANKSDMPLIAGILWNRLLQNIKLDVDATLQYSRDDILHYGEASNGSQLTNYSSDGGWWKPITSADKNIDSAFNTYKNGSLPPHPISNPGLDAINAVLNPTKTECIFYLHDSDGEIHCAKTYDEHLSNIRKYLK